MVALICTSGTLSVSLVQMAEGTKMAVAQDKQRVQITLPEAVLKKLDEACEVMGVNRSSAINLALLSWFKQVDEVKAVMD